MAPFVAGIEFVWAILLLVGLFTRIAAAPLIAVMIVATIVSRRLEQPRHGTIRLRKQAALLHRLRVTWQGTAPAELH